MATTRYAARAPQQPPEELPYAGLGIRLVAALLDFIVLASAFMLFVAVGGLHLLLRSNWGADANIPNSVYWASFAIVGSFFVFLPWYFVALWWWRGQSVGMMAVRIAVTDRSGDHLSFGRAFMRTITWPLSVIPLGIGLIPMLFDREGRALHDMLSGTVVVELP